MSPDDRSTERLSRLLAASRARANPERLARARARIEARARAPRTFAWLGRPAALAGACALLVATLAVSFVVLRDTGSEAGDTSLVSSLLGDDGSYGLPGDAVASPSPGVDSGGVGR